VSGQVFDTTQWSMVRRAANDSTNGRVALEKLCSTYWPPIYAYLRRRGYSREDADDLTQAFFARVLASRFVANANSRRGRFRSYLLTAVNHFLADEWDHVKAQKRGGGKSTVALDVDSAEAGLQIGPADNLTPEKIYDRHWAQALLLKVFDELRQEYQRNGKAALFGDLQGCLSNTRGEVPYSDLAARTNMSEGALRIAVHRMRQRYRDLLRAEIGQTVADPRDIDDELLYLQRTLAS
jgi:RNA polymerase sigma factor (sigma-70 family)